MIERVLVWLLLSLCLVGAEPLPDRTLKWASPDQILPQRESVNGRPLTLNECELAAFQSHPSLLAARAAVAQNLAAVNQIWGLYAPNASLSLSRSLQGQIPIQPFPGPGLTYSNGVRLQVDHVLYDFKQRRYQAQAAWQQLKSSTLSLHDVWIAQASQIRQAYHQVVVSEVLLAIQSADIVIADEGLRIARGLYAGGQKSRVDVLQAQLEFEQSRSAAEQARARHQANLVLLAQTTGLELEFLQQRPLVNYLFQEVDLPERAQALKELEQHPSLAALDFQARGFDTGAQAELRKGYPTFSFGAVYGLSNTGTLHTVDGTLPQNQDVSMGFTLRFPLGAVVEPGAEVQRALAEQTRQQLDGRRLELVRQLDTALSDGLRAKKRQELGLTRTQLALRTVELAYRRYQLGMATILELNNAGNLLNAARIDYISAVADRKLAEVSLLSALGRPSLPMDDLKIPEEPGLK